MISRHNQTYARVVELVVGMRTRKSEAFLAFLTGPRYARSVCLDCGHAKL